MIGNTYHGVEVDHFVDGEWITWTIPNVQRVYFSSPGSFWVAPMNRGVAHINIDFRRCEVELINDFYTVRICD